MLDPETLSHVSDIILSPPAANKYITLSDRLIREFVDSEHQEIRKHLTELQLGDDKPSHLLRKIKELSGGQLQDKFLKDLWLQRLPSEIQAVLSVSSETLDKLAEIADKVADVALPTAVYSATSTPEPNPSAEIQELAKQIVELKLQISRMSRPEINNSFVGSYCEIGTEQQTVRLFVLITNVFVRTLITVSHLATSYITNLVIDLALSRKTRKHDYNGVL
ncbi:uncharacterized protein TNCV_842551 [Trichonephila clavipes]|nr:uncharacterized protein TNCV_842551 [Trichonephila clavipes]